MIKLDGVRLNVGESIDELKKRSCKKAGVNANKIKYFCLLKKSLDARDRKDIHYICSVEMDYSEPTVERVPMKNYRYPNKPTVVVGFGPAGMFCALHLARQGFNPIVIERGKTVEDRKNSVAFFNANGTLDENSNIQFGEGGAGAFSDGKLNTGVKSESKRYILQEFVSHGAPEQILYDGKPHIGSDKLPTVIKNIREEIISLGGSFFFDTKLIGIKKSGERITSITVEDKKGAREIEVENLVLAIGHSARDTYETLIKTGVTAEPKDMAIGVRIEHLQKNIDLAQYGAPHGELNLPSADYKLTANAKGRGVFTFCMCPGGYVVASSSEKGGVVTNGMSNFARDGENANSAVVVQIKKSDYGENIFDGINFLRSIEQKAFEIGGGDYKAPYQLVGDFISGKLSKGFGSVKPTYPLGVKSALLTGVLPSFVTEPLKEGLLIMDRKLRGFADKNAVLTGVETRTSSPVRFTRNEVFASPFAQNLYPVGETGHAGGIMSAGLDGLKAGRIITAKYE